MAIAILFPLLGFAQADVTITVTNLNPANDNIWVKGSIDEWAGHQMVQDGDTWTYTYAAVAEGTYSWGCYQGDATGEQVAWLIVGENPSFTVTGTEVTGTITYDIPAPGTSFDVLFTVTDEAQTQTLIKIKGSMNSWAEVDMESQGGGVWTKTLPVEVGSWEWGAVNGEGGWLIEGPNVAFTVAEDGTVTGDVSYTILAPGDIPIIFNVDMNDEIDNINFIPGTDILEVVGSFNNFQGELVGAEWQLTDADEDGFYTLTSPAQFRVDQEVSFKFRKNGDWELAETPGDPDGKLNRKYTVTAIEKDNTYNAIWGENYFHNLGQVESLTDIYVPIGATVGDLNLPAVISVTMGTPDNLTAEVVGLPVTWLTDDFVSDVEGEFTILGDIAIDHEGITYFNGYNLKASVTVFVGTEETTYTVTFTVTDGETPIEGAAVVVNQEEVNTDATGVATFQLVNGSYAYAVTKDGYEPSSGEIAVDGADVAESVVLTPVNSVNNQMLNNFVLYPNPAKEYLNITSSKQINSIKVFNITGQEILTINDIKTEKYTVNTSMLNSGVYILTITDVNGYSTSKKMIKK